MLAQTVVQRFEKERPGGPGGDMVVVYLAALGAVDRDGHACILPPDAQADVGTADRSWLRVTSLLEKLAEKRQRNTAVLLVLDACRSAHAESIGVFDGTFAAAVQHDVKATGHDRMWVITSAGVGETACVSAADGGSVFATVFTDGLAGVADTTPWGDGDGRVELGELAVYLADEVDFRAGLNHGRRQRPLFVSAGGSAGAADDDARGQGVSWAVRDKRMNPASADLETNDESESMAWIRSRWEQAQKLRERSMRDRPVAWAWYTSMLLWAERLADAGRAGSREFADAKAKVEKVENHLQSPLLDLQGQGPLPGVRLARLAAAGGIETVDGDWKQVIESWARQAINENPREGEDQPAPPARTAAQWRSRMDQAWEKLVALTPKGNASISRDAWTRWREMVGTPPRDGASSLEGLLPGEVQAAALLADAVEPAVWDNRPGVFGDVVRLVADAALARCADDVRADEGVQRAASLDKADLARRRAFDLTAVGDSQSLRVADRESVEAADAYTTAQDAAETISNAWQVLDRVRANWPDLAIWQAAVTAVSGEEPDLVVDAALVDKLQGAVHAAGTPPTDVARLRGHLEPVATAFDRWQQRHDDCEQLANRNEMDARTLAEIRAALKVPLITGLIRCDLAKKARDIARKLAGEQELSDRGGVGKREPADRSGAGDASRVKAVAAGIRRLAVAFGLSIDQSEAIDTAHDLAAEAGRIGHSVREQAAKLVGLRVEKTPADSGVVDNAAAANRTAAVLAAGSLSDREAIDDGRWPATAQMRRAWGMRLVACAEGMLDDLFAGLDAGQPPWCTTAAHDCLVRAPDLLRDASPRDAELLDRVEQRLARLEDVDPEQ
ncbi:MAG: hypothetical protein ACOYK7_09910, partial [Pirellulales bacterium]